LHHIVLQFQYMQLCASGELCNWSHRYSHIAGGTTIEHESWLHLEALRHLPHCLCRSIPQPESSITYGAS